MATSAFITHIRVYKYKIAFQLGCWVPQLGAQNGGLSVNYWRHDYTAPHPSMATALLNAAFSQKQQTKPVNKMKNQQIHKA